MRIPVDFRPSHPKYSCKRNRNRLRVKCLATYRQGWKMENGQWKMENEQWTMGNGKWKMENG